MSPKITLEQWQTFRCVVDEGSFARAAEKLNKSQSSISYAIGQLNAQLPQPVLRVEGRRSVLTEAGENPLPPCRTTPQAGERRRGCCALACDGLRV